MYNAMSPIIQRPYVPQSAPRKKEEQTENQGENLSQEKRQPQEKPMRRPNVMNKRPQTTQQVAQDTPVVQNQTRIQQTPTQNSSAISASNTQASQAPKNDRPINAVNNKVNIAQILKDFRNTMSAIATPDIILEEVEEYLKDIENHTKGEAPSINYVQTNLLNAASIVDKYISDMLEKESQVVSKWLDALFLQRINYKFDTGEVNEAFLVKFPENNKAQPAEVKPEPIQPQQAEQTPVGSSYEPIAEYHDNPISNTGIKDYVPQQNSMGRMEQQQIQPNAFTPTTFTPNTFTPSQREEFVGHPQYVSSNPQPKPFRQKPTVTIIQEDTELKSLFKAAQKHIEGKNPSKAMNIFNKAFERAKAINDNEGQSKACFEMGKIYGENNYLVQALNSYNRSLKSTTDNDLKSEVHYQMANIYDTTNQIPSAMKHYMAAVSYAGENNNLVVQSKSLAKIGNIYCEKGDEGAFNYYNQALGLVEMTTDPSAKGFVFSNVATGYASFNRPQKALQYYADAVKNYKEAGSNIHIAENYKLAGELMLEMNKPTKARVLLEKGLRHLNKTDDVKLSGEIIDLLELA